MSQDLKDRTKKFAIDVWYTCSKLPQTREFNNYVNQLLRSSSSVAANYRAAMRAKSNADFIYKLKIVEEEADESQFF
ncbi:four helix bundle protein [Algoriphagus halophilus]|uniref:four helix bundle protein n=1 Tax=Algoriphagus halophilus TaxID=226505 RepID=UPI00358FE07B